MGHKAGEEKKLGCVDIRMDVDLTETLRRNSLAQVRNEVANLWDEMQTPLEERIAFLAQVEESQPFSDDIYAMYQDQHERLRLKVPAINAISRREKLKYQLDALQETLSVPVGQRDPNVVKELQGQGRKLMCIA